MAAPGLARSRAGLIDLARNPYPLSHQEQMETAFRLAGGRLAVNVLERPYIFGGTTGRGTLWGYVMDKVRSMGPVRVTGAAGGMGLTEVQFEETNTCLPFDARSIARMDDQRVILTASQPATKTWHGTTYRHSSC